MKNIDARGLSCPQPVLLCQSAIKAGEKEFVVFVDDVAPLENVTRFAQNHGYKVSVKHVEDYDELHCVSE